MPVAENNPSTGTDEALVSDTHALTWKVGNIKIDISMILPEHQG